MDKAGEEGRDDTGLWLACQLRDERYSRNNAWEVLHSYEEAVEQNSNPPYTETDIREIRKVSRWMGHANLNSTDSICTRLFNRLQDEEMNRRETAGLRGSTITPLRALSI